MKIKTWIALKWYRKAANQGDARAQYNLGLVYTDGQGVAQDYAEAANWYRLAAGQGHFIAQYNLGLMYADGKGVAHDFVQAHMLLNLAAAAFPVSEREIVVKNRDRVAKEMTPDQITQSQ